MAFQGPVSRTSRELFGPEKPFVKLRPAYSVKLIFSHVVKGIKTKISFVPRDAYVLKIQRELCHPKYARKVSGLSTIFDERANYNSMKVTVGCSNEVLKTAQKSRQT